MKLREAAMNIKTNWREIIIKLLDLYPEIENAYKMDYIHLDGVHKIYPETENIFNCFNYFNVEDTKVVILGQDPYHGEGQANGLAFAVNSDIKIPPSLRNILKKFDKDTKFIVHGAKIHMGSSGGPLFDKDGQIIGLNTLISDTAAENIAVSADHILELIR